jgi:short-subunit dehydrogenase
MSFAGQVAVVTGASSGIGWELAKELGRQGAKVGVLARRQEHLDRLCGEIRAGGGIAEAASADIRERQATLDAIGGLAKRLGAIDLLIANAGVGSMNKPDNLNVSGAENVFRANLLGVVYSIEAVLSEMLQRGSGQIAAISSLAAYKGIPNTAAYCASKAAVNVYMESLRISLRGRGVHFTTVCPGFIRTPMTENNKGMFLVMEPQKAARKIVDAIRRKKKLYNFPWVTTRLMKLTRWAPDWLLQRTMPSEIGGKDDK